MKTEAMRERQRAKRVFSETLITRLTATTERSSLNQRTVMCVAVSSGFILICKPGNPVMVIILVLIVCRSCFETIDSNSPELVLFPPAVLMLREQ